MSAELEPVFMDAIDDCFLLDIRPNGKKRAAGTGHHDRNQIKSTVENLIIKIISTAYYQTKNLIEAILRRRGELLPEQMGR